MSVLVDTPIWSAMFRRGNPGGKEVDRLRDLVAQHRARIIGPIRQEILSGVRTPEQFARVRTALRPFPDLPLTETDFELAAEFCNTCRSKGVQGSNTDFLICAVAHRNAWEIFTADKDFAYYGSHLPISIFAA